MQHLFILILALPPLMIGISLLSLLPFAGGTVEWEGRRLGVAALVLQMLLAMACLSLLPVGIYLPTWLPAGWPGEVMGVGLLVAAYAQLSAFRGARLTSARGFQLSIDAVRNSLALALAIHLVLFAVVGAFFVWVMTYIFRGGHIG